MEPLGDGDPRWIGAYRLLGRLGAGGMGRVYLARSERGRTVAVKVVQEELARQPSFRERFAKEVNAARRVGGQWTAPVLDADTDAATPWVATGYIAGPSLQEVVDEDYGPLPEHSVYALAAGLVEALRAIHGAELVHRDLKPSNVLVTIDGPKVIDFGIARALDSVTGSGLTQTGAVIGSPGFMSPEQVRGERVTPAGDVFCLGAVLAYAATGRMPFGTADSGFHALLFRIAEEEPDLTGLSGPLRELVADCLVKDPAGRPSLDDLAARVAAHTPPGGTWLPGEVLAQLGRHAVRLLDSEDPETAASALAQSGAAVGPAPGGVGVVPGPPRPRPPHRGPFQGRGGGKGAGAGAPHPPGWGVPRRGGRRVVKG
ncbi:serine/threonine-protein kinase, partial [Streptomyces chitinivorans]